MDILINKNQFASETSFLFIFEQVEQIDSPLFNSQIKKIEKIQNTTNICCFWCCKKRSAEILT